MKGTHTARKLFEHHHVFNRTLNKIQRSKMSMKTLHLQDTFKQRCRQNCGSPPFYFTDLTNRVVLILYIGASPFYNPTTEINLAHG